MTTYNPPTDTELGIEKPILSSVNIRLRDMPLAMFEGASGAPKLQAAALSGEAIDFDALINADYTTDTDHTLGSATGVTTSTSYVKLATLIAPVNGQFNIRIGAKTDDLISGIAYVRAYKNGVAFGTERSNGSTTYSYWNENLACTANDKIQMYVRTNSDSYGATGYIALVATNAPAAASAGS